MKKRVAFTVLACLALYFPACDLKETFMGSSKIPMPEADLGQVIHGLDALEVLDDDLPEPDQDTGPPPDCDDSSCGNGYCIAECGETAENCPEDCCAYDGCGDEVCDPSGFCPETLATCPCDCCLCSDGVCDEENCNETPLECPEDCCSTACGNGFCEGDECAENGNNCPEDCCGSDFCGDGICDADCGEDIPGNSHCTDDCCLCGDGICQSEGCGEIWLNGEGNCAADCAPCGNDVCDPGEGPELCPVDCCGACGDAICRGGVCGEDDANCPQDCFDTPCGDGECAGDDNPIFCPEDCPETGCGNGMCEPDEDSTSCHEDCTALCGDCVCSDKESFATCPVDCGYCGDGFCTPDCEYLAETKLGCPVDCCTPDCAGKKCGDDGCSGSCGECPVGKSCVDGKCKCVPDCTGAVCGDDGCGGSCGKCLDEEHCKNGQCQPGPCQPECGGKECGDDTCGGQCGDCDDKLFCTADSCQEETCVFTIDGDYCVIDKKCLPAQTANTDNACEACEPTSSSSEWTTLPEGAVCGMGKVCHAQICCHVAENCQGQECGDDGCGGICGECGGEQEVCNGGQCICIPECGGLDCGDDGCGGSCGACDDLLLCTEDGCDEGQCLSELMDGFCLFEGLCKPAGSVDMLNPCSVCDPDANPQAWSPADDGVLCGVGQVCFGGSCCSFAANCLGKTCGDDGCGGECGSCEDDLSCTIDSCDDGQCANELQGNYCIIENDCVPAGAYLGDNQCMRCDPGENPLDWSPWFDGAPCGPNSKCLDGVCLCESDCDGKECGDDGCGGSCGECVLGVCDNGVCPCDCEGVPVFLVCDMLNGVQYNNDCEAVCGGAEMQNLVIGPCPCLPDCAGFDCGDDGCGGSCGECDPLQYEFCEMSQCVSAGELPCEECESYCDSLEQPCKAECQFSGMWCESENCDQFIAGMAQCEPDDDVCLDLWQGQYDDCVDECLEQNSNCMEGCDLLVGSCTATCDCCEPDCDSKDCGDDSCGGSCGACKFWEKCVGGKCDLKSPALIISDPMNNEYIMMDPLGTSITVTMDIDWAPYPHASKSIECYLAGVLVGSTEASQFEFTNVPPGVSTLACRLTENGEPLMTENSTAVVTIKVRKPCLEHSDCKDGNPCSIDACVVSNSAGEKMCAYGPVYSACCCVSGFDCLKPGGGDFWFTCSVPNSTCYYGCIEDGQCDDNNPCTEDTCEPCEGCINEWIDIPECDFDG